MSGDFRYIELCTGGAANRGRIVEVPDGVGMPDYYGRGTVTDAYCSVYRFDGRLAGHVQKTGSVRGYAGACRATGVHFDFDGTDALADVRAFVESVCTDRLGIYIDNFLIWFSGNKGFHVLLKHPDIESMQPSADVPDKIKRLALTLAGRFGTFDKTVYDKTRIFRIQNSRHGKTGLFKIPLLAGEIWTLNMAGIRSLAGKQRSIQDAVEQWTTQLRRAA